MSEVAVRKPSETRAEKQAERALERATIARDKAKTKLDQAREAHDAAVGILKEAKETLRLARGGTPATAQAAETTSTR